MEYGIKVDRLLKFETLYLNQYKGSITQNLGRLKDVLDQMSLTQCACANSDFQASRKKIGFELAIVIDMHWPE